MVIAKFLTVTKTVFQKFMSFECLQVHLKNEEETLVRRTVYRPPGYAGLTFLDEFETFVIRTESANTNDLFDGDFVIWMDEQNSSVTRRFTDTLGSFSIRYYVKVPTHKSG